jgi:DNA invertase Pin-like site-specific DNA recombinase
MEWWKQSQTDSGTAVQECWPAVAYYRHSAQIGQENSVEIQQDNIVAFAKKNNLKIIHEFADRGKSGLNAEGRPAFNELMEWVRTRDDFLYILVLDITRWGRFQDMDLPAHYDSLCKQHGKQVVYIDIGMPKADDSLITHLRKSIDRYQSAEYSRALSKKVFEGCAKVATQGYRPGGAAPYAFHRMMLDERKQRDRILQPGQRKAIQNGRVILVPGDSQQVEIVNEIFLLFVKKGYCERQIAGHLNERQIPSPGGVRWSDAAVRNILTNQQYTGAVVYNRTTQRLKTKIRGNPQENWIVTPNAYAPIVDSGLFERAREMLEGRKRRCDPQEMLKRMRELYAEYGVITSRILQFDKDCPGPGMYAQKFEGFAGAFQAMFGEVLTRIKSEVFRAIQDSVRLVNEYDNFLVINNDYTIVVQPSVPIPSGYGEYWAFKPDHRPAVDITLGVPLSSDGEPEILGYLAMPRLMVPEKYVRLSTESHARIELQAHNGLEFLKKLAEEQR